MDGSIRVEMFGAKVPAKGSIELGTEDNSLIVETIQITQVSLSDKPASGRHTVFCEANECKWVMGNLIPGTLEQFQTDYMGRHTIKISNTGASDVYVSGFKTLTMLDDEDGFEDIDDDEEEDDEDEESEEEDEDVKAKVPLENGKPAKPSKELPQAVPTGGDDDDDDDEDEEEDDDEEEEDDDEDAEGEELQGAEFSDMDDDDEEGDDDDDDEGDEDDEDDDEDDDEEEEEPKKPTGKRPVPAAQQPAAKKAKAEPAAAPASKKAASGEAEWEKSLKDFLKKEGPTPLSQLGSKVKKPATLGAGAKLRKFIEARSKLFKIDASLQVSLA